MDCVWSRAVDKNRVSIFVLRSVTLYLLKRNDKLFRTFIVYQFHDLTQFKILQLLLLYFFSAPNITCIFFGELLVFRIFAVTQELMELSMFSFAQNCMFVV